MFRYLEAIAHDVFIIGYAEAQKQDSQLKQWQTRKGLKGQYIHKESSSQRYKDANEVQQIYQQINVFLNERMSTMMPVIGNTRLTVVPQLWRTFESQVFTSDGESSIAGVYRTYNDETLDKTFNPFKATNNMKKFGLDELINEFS